VARNKKCSSAKIKITSRIVCTEILDSSDEDESIAICNAISSLGTFLIEDIEFLYQRKLYRDE